MWYSNCDKSITLIRHGKTFANEKGLYCGFSDIELSEDGIASLYEIKKAKIYPDFDFYITSGMKRANKTMDILFGKPYIVDENFKEINFGDFELKSYYELREDKSYLKWIENIEKNKIPNGESKIEFKERIFKAFKDTYHRDIKNIAIICHNGVIAEIMQEIFKEEDKNFYDWSIGNGKGYSIFFKNKEITYKKIGERL